MIANAVFLSSSLSGPSGPAPDRAVSPSPAPEPAATPGPEPLVTQFAARTLYTIGEAGDERLTFGYWLNVPSTVDEDPMHDDSVSSDPHEVRPLFVNLFSLMENFLVHSPDRNDRRVV